MSEPAGLAVPATVPASEAPADAERYDVVVVGFGIAGGCAALEAARAGARVLLLERAAVHGGTSSMSGGHFYLGAGTAVQQATGHEDSVDAMARYLIASTKEPDEPKIRAYCEGSVEHFGWLEALGFEFERSFFPGKAVIQPGTEGLMYTGNEKVWPYRDQVPPAPRGHKVPVPGDTEGTRIVMDLLRERIEEAGVEVRFETGASQLVVTDDGAVAGVAWKSFERTGVVLADSVVIAAGGFVMNPDMVARYTPALGSKLFTLGGLRVTVDGQVQREDGSVVAGLYAAGACASNLAQDGAGYCSGTQLGEGSFFGRRAGKHAALAAKGADTITA
jgi:succinate dehydrogenase/fumarate reductase flavoprotein subunit